MNATKIWGIFLRLELKGVLCHAGVALVGNFSICIFNLSA
jgi:hypothetical protein